ncbi:hypothetical protein EAL2_c10120 [Peptoclostridium acidaminophilum DSM 3953]|uniref:DUF2520 domain-containing protein n=1 Tax=Peptoclostridium acidaminophilum DSM 3953 TaxID=1286171 RepID=W8U5V7_PEPAC|nr:DUF2520 domain-containing protein [Peptoclostridium acidaminophilum]AHM56311.1 hypothetical protein EAL2_c10120 [Peptoclostridium acidaminophilum DSM 3953]
MGIKIGFVGAGKTATALGIYFKSCGFEITGYSSKSADSAQKAAGITGSKACDARRVAEGSDLIFIATPDGSIRSVCKQMAAAGLFTESHTVVHLSGALSSDELQSAREAGSTIASLHPLQSFADPQEAAEKLRRTVFTLEGEGEGLSAIAELLESCGNSHFTISKESKPLYHAAACFASNYVVSLFSCVLETMEHIGIDKARAFEAIRPLTDGTLDNISLLGIEKSLTGPIARGDADTIRRHMAAFEESGLESAQRLYCELGLRAAQIAGKTIQSPERLVEIGKILKERGRHD